jgi:hypothetical protein
MSTATKIVMGTLALSALVGAVMIVNLAAV